MTLSVIPTKPKRKRYNKNKKAAWRKKIDLTDIEDAIQDERREERLGGPIAEISSEELFSLDFADDLSQSKKTAKIKPEKRASTEGLKPKNKHGRLVLNSHRLIYGLLGAKAISKKKAVQKQKEATKVRAAKKVSGPTLRQDVRKTNMLETRRKALKMKRKVPKAVVSKEDIWNKRNNELDAFGETGKTYMKEPIQFFKVQTRQAKVRIPSSLHEKTSSLPAIVPPKSGASYNPSYEAHQKLLAEAVDFESERQKNKAKEQRFIAKYMPKGNGGISAADRIAEMAEGLPLEGSANLDEVEEEQGDEDANTAFGQRRREKRSLQSRKRQKTLKIREQIRLKKKETNRLESEVFRVKSFKKEIERNEERLENMKKKRERRKEAKEGTAKRLSKRKFQEDDVLVPLGTDLPDNLRSIEPIGVGFVHTFKNMQRRNVMEPRVRVKKTKAKTKKIFKKNHKDDMNKFMKTFRESKN